jgi:hypothetical protein
MSNPELRPETRRDQGHIYQARYTNYGTGDLAIYRVSMTIETRNGHSCEFFLGLGDEACILCIQGKQMKAPFK